MYVQNDQFLNVTIFLGSCKDNKLCVDADGFHFTFNGERVFLSGINQAWVAYAYDFGADQYQYRRQQYEKTIQQLSQAGGNSISKLCFRFVFRQNSPLLYST